MQAVLDVLIFPYHIRRVRECIHFIIVVGGIFLLGLIVLYRQAFYMEVHHYRQTWGYASSSQAHDPFLSSPSFSTTTYQYEAIEGLEDMSLGEVNKNAQTMYDYNLDSYLSSKLSTYTLAFNTVVPGNRIIIPSLDIDVPVVNVNYASDTKLADADFAQELQSGVVRYPFTALPGEEGNGLIFGHSSVDMREKDDNPYGFVFYKLSKLLPGEEIHIVWEGKRYTYIVEEKTIKSPTMVNEELKKHTDGKFLTLMACYPLFTDANRMLVRARYKEDLPHLTAVSYGDAIN